jgi:hypothetical protein
MMNANNDTPTSYLDHWFLINGFKVNARLVAWDDDRLALVCFEWTNYPRLIGKKFKSEYIKKRNNIVDIFRRLLKLNAGCDYNIMIGVDDLHDRIAFSQYPELQPKEVLRFNAADLTVEKVSIPMQ